jgi:hypothetical protein
MNQKIPFDVGNKQITIKEVADQIVREVKTPPLKRGGTGKFQICINGHDLTLTSAQVLIMPAAAAHEVIG